MKAPNQNGIWYCKFTTILSILGLFIGIGFVFSNVDKLYFFGWGLSIYCSWTAAAFFFIAREPLGVTGRRKLLVPKFLEDSVHKNFFYENEKGSNSMLHAAKRFAIFCAVLGFVCGFLGINYIVHAVIAGIAAVAAFEIFIRSREEK